jgi:hypothetical protein
MNIRLVAANYLNEPGTAVLKKSFCLLGNSAGFSLRENPGTTCFLMNSFFSLTYPAADWKQFY